MCSLQCTVVQILLESGQFQVKYHVIPILLSWNIEAAERESVSGT